MTAHPLGNVFQAMMEKGQDQIPQGIMRGKSSITWASNTTTYVTVPQQV
jgi:hypothetical protein